MDKEDRVLVLIMIVAVFVCAEASYLLNSYKIEKLQERVKVLETAK